MILPTKHLSTDRSLINLSAEISNMFDNEVALSNLWEKFQKSRQNKPQVSFEWFALSLDLLFIMGRIDSKQGKIVKV